MATKKVKVLVDTLRVYNKVNEYRQPETQYGYQDYTNGDVVELEDWIAERVLKQGIQSPTGAFRPAAIPADEAEEDHVVKGFRDDVSPNPEADFGSTRLDGTLISDPDGELADQRREARKAELTPEKKTQTQAQARQADQKNTEK